MHFKDIVKSFSSGMHPYKLLRTKLFTSYMTRINLQNKHKIDNP